MAERVGRPARALLERVLERTFRPERYGHLLAGEPLPAEPPAGVGRCHGERYRALVWEALVEWQDWYQLHAGHYANSGEAFDADNMWRIAREFSWLHHHLHGGRCPVWFAEWLADRQLRRRREA
jgi:hypothetical protein